MDQTGSLSKADFSANIYQLEFINNWRNSDTPSWLLVFPTRIGHSLWFLNLPPLKVSFAREENNTRPFGLPEVVNSLIHIPLGDALTNSINSPQLVLSLPPLAPIPDIVPIPQIPKKKEKEEKRLYFSISNQQQKLLPFSPSECKEAREFQFCHSVPSSATGPCRRPRPGVTWEFV